MNAIQPSSPPLRTSNHLRLATPPNPRQRRKPAKAATKLPVGLVMETTLKLAVNVTLSVAAVSTLMRILPYQLSQQEKLQEIRAEVNVTEGRVNRLRDDFSRHFDPQQTKALMQEQSNRVDPKQLQVVWTNVADLADTDEVTP
ncbi:hypothetical protein [Trichocoleus sp. FACHB-262]|uniref:slr1601 family putative cell division protein n=1 Tax=Trichocoleus sp. FACHB-262 TaxID=2692869 RepID=UPI00168582CF|nr:hypothetical protein [Trichocoleus sp. FACHB-262]MBD2123217.1 hypothetical protein [Trichocoleus sp. FACHB-262]